MKALLAFRLFYLFYPIIPEHKETVQVNRELANKHRRILLFPTRFAGSGASLISSGILPETSNSFYAS
jgi:hypothetical protein